MFNRTPNSTKYPTHALSHHIQGRYRQHVWERPGLAKSFFSALVSQSSGNLSRFCLMRRTLRRVLARQSDTISFHSASR
ncbi:hypothetical protein LMG22931_07699 [Paraburkholderia nemoris]|nr:hypothetical protein LMG22931_07699 [Paraburkholderia nemoris]